MISDWFLSTYLIGCTLIIHSKIALRHPSKTERHNLIFANHIEAKRGYYLSMEYLAIKKKRLSVGFELDRLAAVLNKYTYW